MENDLTERMAVASQHHPMNVVAVLTMICINMWLIGLSVLLGPWRWTAILLLAAANVVYAAEDVDMRPVPAFLIAALIFLAFWGFLNVTGQVG
jgi:hypothetical protein